MNAPRTSIAALMICVLVVAIGTAALRYASAMWAGIMLLVVLGLLAVSVLGITYRRRAARAGWLGFLLFGGGFLFLASMPGFDANDKPELPTTPVLKYLHEVMNSPERVRELDLVGNVSMSVNSAATLKASTLRADRVIVKYNDNTRTALTGLRLALFTAGSDWTHFERIGQCLFALLAGCCGAVVARWFERWGARDRERADGASSPPVSGSAAAS